MLSLIGVTHVLDGLEVVTDHSWLDVGLQLARLRLHPPVFPAESSCVLFRIGLFLVGIGRLVKEGV